MSGLTVGPGRYPADMSRVGLGTPPPATPAPQVGRAGGRALDGPRPGPDPAAARAHRRADDGHRRARRRGAARTEPAVRAAGDQPARAQRHRRDRDHLRRHGHAGAGLAVDRPDAARPRRGGPGPGPHPARPHRAAVGAAARAGAPDVLQGRLQLPRAERDHRTRPRPVLARACGGAGRRRPAHPHDPDDLARHPGPVRPAVPHARPRHHRAHRLGRDPGRVRPPRPRPVRRGADHLGAAAAGPPLRPRRRPRALARRGEPAGAVPPGQRHPQRGPDDRAHARGRRAGAARPRPRVGGPCAIRGSCSAWWSSRWGPRSSSRRSWPWASSGWPRRAGAAGGCATSRWSRRCRARSRPRCSSCSASAPGSGSAGRARWAPRTSSAAGCRWRRTWASSRVRSGSSPVSATTPTRCSRSPAGSAGSSPRCCACGCCCSCCAGGWTR